MGLSWTGTDEEAARLLAGSFGDPRSAKELLERAALVPHRRGIRSAVSRIVFWRTLLANLRASDDPEAIDRLLRTAVALHPALEKSLQPVETIDPIRLGSPRAARGTTPRQTEPVPPAPRSAMRYDSEEWPLPAVPAPSPGRSSKSPAFFEELPRDVGYEGEEESLEVDTTKNATGEATGFARDPVVESLMPLRAGAPLVLSVDLARPTGAPTAARITVSGLPDDWQTLPIVARATGVGVSFADGRAEGVVLVRRDGASIPCTLIGAVDPDAEHVDLAIAFYDRGRYCGEVRRRLGLDGGAPATADTATADTATAGAAIEPGIAAPDLTVVVRSLDPGRPGLLHWDLRIAERHQLAAIPDLPRELSGKHDLETDPRPWALRLFDTFAASDAGNLRILEGIGEALWAATPECFRQTYWALRAAAGEHFSIQLVCGEPFVPWEFLRPVRGDEALPIVMQNHPVARWMPEFAGTQRGQFRGERIVTIASPQPRSHTPALPMLQAARAQSDLLRDRFRAEPLRATYDDVMALLESTPDQPIGILHFAGHGAIDANLDNARIFLDDDPLTAVEVKRTRVQLGAAGHTLVFLNACSVGQTGRALGTPGGWPAAFLHRAFRGFLAPISRVWELDAARFAQRFVGLTWRDRVPIGEALRQLRAGADAATPFAYLYYGDVMARFA